MCVSDLITIARQSGTKHRHVVGVKVGAPYNYRMQASAGGLGVLGRRVWCAPAAPDAERYMARR